MQEKSTRKWTGKRNLKCNPKATRTSICTHVFSVAHCWDSHHL